MQSYNHASEEKFSVAEIIQNYEKARDAKRFANIFVSATQKASGHIRLQDLDEIDRQMSTAAIRKTFENTYIKKTTPLQQQIACDLMHLLMGIYFLKTTRNWTDPKVSEHFAEARKSKNNAIADYAYYYLQLIQFHRCDYIAHTRLETLQPEVALKTLKEYLQPLVDIDFGLANYHIAYISYCLKNNLQDKESILRRDFNTELLSASLSSCFDTELFAHPTIFPRMEAAANAGCTMAIMEMARYYETKRDFPKCLPLYEKLARMGSADALTRLAELNNRYQSQTHPTKIPAHLVEDEGFPLISKASEVGHPYALLTLGMAELQANNPAQAASLLFRAATSHLDEIGIHSARTAEAKNTARQKLLAIKTMALPKEDALEVWFNQGLLVPESPEIDGLGQQLHALAADDSCFVFRYFPKDETRHKQFRAQLITLLGADHANYIGGRFDEINQKRKLPGQGGIAAEPARSTPAFFERLGELSSSMTAKEYFRVPKNDAAKPGVGRRR